MADDDRIVFTRRSADRIANAVRTVEGLQEPAIGLKFEGPRSQSAGRGGGAVRLGTFTGAWPKGEFKTVTLTGTTATVLVKNVTLPIDLASQSPNTAQRSVLFSSVAGDWHAVEIEQGGVCGSWKEYIISLAVSNCSGSGALALVRSVNIGTAAEPPGNSGSGPVSTVELVSGGANYAQRGREAPTVAVSAASTNVTFSLSYQELSGSCGIPYWRISGATAAGSTTFWTPQSLSVAPLNSATEELPAVLTLNTTGVSIVDGGKYYKESNSLPAITHTVTLTVTQQTPSAGTGAQFTPTVDTDPTSPSFGTVTSISIDDGGDDYVAWKWSGSIPFANVDLALLSGFKVYETQVLGHDGGCLKWFDVTSCGTATTSGE